MEFGILVFLTLLFFGAMLFDGERREKRFFNERRRWQQERQDLLDRIMVLKGERQYAPVIESKPEEEHKPTEEGWVDL